MFIFIKKFWCFVLSIMLYSSLCKADCLPNINKYVWKSALHIVRVLPLNCVDPFGGVILTEWFEVNKRTRYKLDIYVLSGILNSQSVRVSVFKQVKKGTTWEYVPVSTEISNNIEESILNEAKKLRLLSNFK